MLAGVIWMLGWCMVLLGTMVRMNGEDDRIVGLAIFFFSNYSDMFSTDPYGNSFIHLQNKVRHGSQYYMLFVHGSES